MSTAASHLVQTVILAVTDIEKYRNERDKHENERRNNITFKAPPYPNICQKIGRYHVVKEWLEMRMIVFYFKKFSPMLLAIIVYNCICCSIASNYKEKMMHIICND